MGKGIDFAWHPVLDYAKFRSDGYTFVCRYLSHDSGKNISADEAKGWHDNGIDIVLVWESTATRAEQGHDAGVQDAKDALALAKAVGAPDNVVIFFAVDEDTTVGPHITAYFEGVVTEIPKARVGVYGSFSIVGGCLDHGLVTYAWQTYAWSAGRWDNRAHLRQVQNGVTVNGTSSDLDTSTAADFGQWRAAPPTPPPPPVSHDRWLGLHNPPMRGQDVKNVQHALNLLPNNRLAEDGIYGRSTADTVQVFQEHRGIQERGCGPLTWAALRAIPGVH